MLLQIVPLNLIFPLSFSRLSVVFEVIINLQKEEINNPKTIWRLKTRLREQDTPAHNEFIPGEAKFFMGPHFDNLFLDSALKDQKIPFTCWLQRL